MAKITAYENDILEIFNQNLPWEKLSGTNLLITGATGLIGGCLVEILMKNPNRDYQVYASGRNEERARKRFQSFTNESDFHFIQYDVIHPLNSDIHFDYMIHAASNASPNFFAGKPVEVIKSNIGGVVHLMEYGLCHGMKRFLYISSGEVYGEGDGRVFTEEYSGYVNCATPRACYPSSKRTSETLCISYAEEYNADVVIARPCHIYGPHFTELDNRVYAQFVRNILFDKDIVMKSRGEQVRSWCYVVDCASAILHILLKGERSHVYNVADRNSNISIKEMAEIVADIGNRKVVYEVPDNKEEKGYNVVSKSVFSTLKLQQLGWSPKHTIREGLISTIEESKLFYHEDIAYQHNG